MNARSKARRGQGMTEYIIIVAVVAVLSIGIVTGFGNQLRALFSVTTSVIADEPMAYENHSDPDYKRTIGDLGAE